GPRPAARRGTRRAGAPGTRPATTARAPAPPRARPRAWPGGSAWPDDSERQQPRAFVRGQEQPDGLVGLPAGDVLGERVQALGARGRAARFVDARGDARDLRASRLVLGEGFGCAPELRAKVIVGQDIGWQAKRLEAAADHVEQALVV